MEDLKRGHDDTLEVSDEQLASATQLEMTADPARLADCTFYIVAVPTPIDHNNRPDLAPMISASRSIGPHLKKGDIVVYESTVYPGVTEDICGPILDTLSGLKNGSDFFLGYSPERINPGDKEHTFEKILKVVSGQTPEALERVAKVYASVVKAGVHRAPSIKVAEAAKVIENTQRDLNIALMNELALIFDRMGIRTQDVLEAAGTKWNFLRFTPGLVGGHCIGVDPYYLTMKAEELGYLPEVILAGRRDQQQRRRVPRAEDRQVPDLDGRAAPQGEGRHPGPHVQGERPGPAQLEDPRHHQGAGGVRHPGDRPRPARRSEGSVRGVQGPPHRARQVPADSTR